MGVFSNFFWTYYGLRKHSKNCSIGNSRLLFKSCIMLLEFYFLCGFLLCFFSFCIHIIPEKAFFLYLVHGIIIRGKGGPEACIFIKKETLAKVFSCEFCETFKNTFFTEQLLLKLSFHVNIKSSWWIVLQCVLQCWIILKNNLV